MMGDPRKMNGAGVNKKRFLMVPLSFTLMSKELFFYFKTHRRASIGVLKAKSLHCILWRALLTVLLVTYVFLSEVWSCSNICAGLRLDCESFWISSNCSGMRFLWAACDKGQEDCLWLCFLCWISNVQTLLIIFLLVGIEPLISNGHMIFEVAVLRYKRFKLDPQYSPDQLHRM